MIDTLPVHHLSRVLSIFKNGEVVAFPTGTTYGFGVNALDKNALQKLSDLKGRSEDKAYSLLLPTKTIDQYVEVTEQEKKVLEKLKDVPLTILVKAKESLQHLAKDGKVGARTADHPFTKSLVELLEFPITATSANKSGEEPAYSVDDLMKSFKDATFMAVDGGLLPKHKPSTVAQFAGGKWEVLREGDVRRKQLEDAGNNP